MDRRSFLRHSAAVGALPAVTALLPHPALADVMAAARALVTKYGSRVTSWDGPTTGPRAPRGKKIVVLAADLTNGGVLGVARGVSEAGKAVGWSIKVIDGAGSVAGRSAAFGQALALRPDGIVIDGFDAVEQGQSMKAAKAAHIAMVSWHASPVIGPDPAVGVAANVSTDPMLVSEVAADWAYLDAKGKPAVIIFTDSTYAIAIAKAKKMKSVIESLGGTVLEWVDTPIAQTSTRMPQLTTALLQKYGKRWTHSLAINDLYFDFMAPSLSAAGIPGEGMPRQVAAGDGSKSAYQRIRTGQYQAVTVAEPLTLQGWQLVDELNRALAGQKWSGYVSPLHLVDKANIAFDGGPQDTFDPGNHYRAAYRKIWGV